uniref:hypothetical protein n=1 Tax=Burkholderia anthina TaxID=179879 RepID=UPI001FC885D3|nr:hypothetical protein [Burkholderia anthina]
MGLKHRTLEIVGLRHPLGKQASIPTNVGRRRYSNDLEFASTNGTTYGIATRMIGIAPAFCTKQLGHDIEMFVATDAKWRDGEQNALETSEVRIGAIAPNVRAKQNRRRSACFVSEFWGG